MLLDSQALAVESVVVDTLEASLLGRVLGTAGSELSEATGGLEWLESLARGPETCSVEHDGRGGLRRYEERRERLLSLVLELGL